MKRISSLKSTDLVAANKSTLASLNDMIKGLNSDIEDEKSYWRYENERISIRIQDFLKSNPTSQTLQGKQHYSKQEQELDSISQETSAIISELDELTEKIKQKEADVLLANEYKNWKDQKEAILDSAQSLPKEIESYQERTAEIQEERKVVKNNKELIQGLVEKWENIAPHTESTTPIRELISQVKVAHARIDDEKKRLKEMTRKNEELEEDITALNDEMEHLVTEYEKSNNCL